MALIKNHHYTWSQILQDTGADGSAPYYLPHQGTNVVAACVTTELNPDAPNVILAGNGPDIAKYADYFCEQTNVIPVCIRIAEGDWLCCGHFKRTRCSTDPKKSRNTLPAPAEMTSTKSSSLRRFARD